MLIRISLIVAIIAGLAVGVMNFVQVRSKIVTLQNDLASEKQARASAESERDKTKKELAKTTADLKQTQDTLTATKAEKDKAVADLDVASKKNAQLTEDLSTTKKQRDDMQAELSSYQLAFSTSAQAAAASKQIKSLQDTLAGAQDENTMLAKTITKLKYQLAKYIGDKPTVLLPANLNGKIVAFDPKYEFVVVNIGEDQGVLQDGELLVSRGGKLVAKLVVSSVQKDRCIANIIPGWKIGEVLEGDLVVPAHPQS